MSDLDQWNSYITRASYIRDQFTPLILQWSQAGNDVSNSMINVLFILNGGGLAAIPALHALKAEVSLESLTVTALIFLAGLTLALICGIVTIWNYRLLAGALNESMNASLQENTERFSAFSNGQPDVPSAELVALKASAENYASRSIRLTFYLGWGAGLMSALVFVFGGLTLGGKLNPMCLVLGPICITIP